MCTLSPQSVHLQLYRREAYSNQMSAAHSLGHRNTKQRGVCRNFRAADGHRVVIKIWLNRRSRHLF